MCFEWVLNTKTKTGTVGFLCFRCTFIIKYLHFRLGRRQAPLGLFVGLTTLKYKTGTVALSVPSSAGSKKHWPKKTLTQKNIQGAGGGMATGKDWCILWKCVCRVLLKTSQARFESREFEGAGVNLSSHFCALVGPTRCTHWKTIT